MYKMISKTKSKSLSKSKTKPKRKSKSKTSSKPSFFQKNKEIIIVSGSILALLAATEIGTRYKFKKLVDSEIRKQLKLGLPLKDAKRIGTEIVFDKYKDDLPSIKLIMKAALDFKE